MNDVVNDRPIRSLDFSCLRIVSALGRGAKGVVFLVKDVESSESFALKVIWRDLIEKKSKELTNNDNGDKYRRISFEQRVLRNVEHPLLPRLRGVLSTDKFVGYAIDYCPGRDLHSLRKQQSEQMFSDDTIRFYAAELVLALEYLHNMGIVYRDLKPENIMIQENGHIMLVDFDLSTKLSPKTPQASPKTVLAANTRSGIKKRRSFLSKFCSSGISLEDPVHSPRIGPDPPSRSDSDSSEKSNSFVGTEEYVAPEIIEGKGHDFAVDWWSLGVVLHEMLYGATPFRGSNRKETFYRILCRPPDLVGEPTPLRNLIRRLLEKDPTKRIGVEEIKGHEFFKGVNWELLLKISRPPNIPARFEHENNESDGRGRDGTKEIDVEKFVQGIFAGGGDAEQKNEVNDEMNKNRGGEKVNNQRHACEEDNFLVF